QVGSLNDSTYDPAPQRNAGVIGAAIYRSSKQSYVVASSAQRGMAGTSMTYAVPGASAGRHIVFDAPEQADGRSTVTAAVEGDRCGVTITAGAGMTGHPLMFTVSTSADGCQVAEATDVPSSAPVDAGVPSTGTGGGGGGSSSAAGGGAAGG